MVLTVAYHHVAMVSKFYCKIYWAALNCSRSEKVSTLLELTMGSAREDEVVM